jgi:hypothetical protein
LKQVLACVTDAHIVNNIHPEVGAIMAFTFSQNPARLSRSPYTLFLIQRFEIIPDPKADGEWKVRTLSYEYNIERRKDKQEVICFHWEGTESQNPLPHIHIGFAAQDKSLPFSPKTHIPSGRVPIEDLVHFLIHEMGVHPRKTDHRSIIKKFRDLWQKFKSW